MENESTESHENNATESHENNATESHENNATESHENNATESHENNATESHENNATESHENNETKVLYNNITVNGFTMPEYYNNLVDIVDNFEVRDDDVWVCSFPKTGTTWVQEMVWSIANNLEFERGKVPIMERFPYFEISGLNNFNEIGENRPDVTVPPHYSDSISFVEKLPSPRFIKSHLPFDLLPRQLKTGEKKPKIVYIVRNAKDACISGYHQAKLFGYFSGSFEDWCNVFLNDEVFYAPFWKHALSYWKKRIEENVLFIKYEDMKKDLPWVITKTATFLGKNLTTDELTILVKHLSFESMKANPAVNNEDLVTLSRQLLNSQENGEFMRNGNTDQWMTDMSPELIERFDNWTRESLKGTRLYL